MVPFLNPIRSLDNDCRVMPRRLLNIASIVCLVVCVALMGMWVRSYHRHDDRFGLFTSGYAFSIRSVQGRLEFSGSFVPEPFTPSWLIQSKPIDQLREKPVEQVGPVTPLNFVTRWGFAIVPFHVSLSSRGYLLIVPFWLPSPRNRLAGDAFPTAVVLAVQPSQPVHRNDVPGRRAGNDRLAGSLVDREVTRRDAFRRILSRFRREHCKCVVPIGHRLRVRRPTS